MKFKKFGMILLLISFFAVLWYSQNRYACSAPKEYVNDDMLYQTVNGDGYYCSIKVLYVFLPILFLVFLQLFFRSSNLAYIYRLVDRKDIVHQKVMQVMINSFVFAVVHIGINIVGMLYLFSYENLIVRGFFQYSFYQFIAEFILFLRFGFLFYGLNIRIKNVWNSAIIIILVHTFIVYGTTIENFAFCKDHMLLERLIQKEISMNQVIQSYIREGAISFGLLYYMKEAMVRKDYYK